MTVVMTAARFGSLQAAEDNAVLCYGSEARNGEHFVLAADRAGYGWAPLRPVPEMQHRAYGRTEEGTPPRPRTQKLQPVALAA